MTIREVAVEAEAGGRIGNAVFEYERKTLSMRVTMPDGTVKNYAAADIYLCLGMARKDFSNVRFLCKGAKINVHPSRMSSQMAGGIVAYELRWGKPTDDDDVVNIFDYEDQDLTADISEQENYYARWMRSLDDSDGNDVQVL